MKALDPKTKDTVKRYAPSFVLGCSRDSRDHAYTADSIADELQGKYIGKDGHAKRIVQRVGQLPSSSPSDILLRANWPTRWPITVQFAERYSSKEKVSNALDTLSSAWWDQLKLSRRRDIST